MQIMVVLMLIKSFKVLMLIMGVLINADYDCINTDYGCINADYGLLMLIMIVLMLIMIVF